MAILKSPPKLPKNETVQLRVEEDIKTKLRKYAEFISSSDSYVVSEALKLLFRKDDEFKVWLEEHPSSSDQPQNGASLSGSATSRASNGKIQEPTGGGLKETA